MLFDRSRDEADGAKRQGAGGPRPEESIVPETRDALFVLAAGAGFFIAMYRRVTMIAETMP